MFNMDDNASLAEVLEIIPWNVLLPIIVLQLLLVVIALVSCIRATETNGPKWMWILLILLINLIGPILYFVLGRRTR